MDIVPKRYPLGTTISDRCAHYLPINGLHDCSGWILLELGASVPCECSCHLSSPRHNVEQPTEQAAEAVDDNAPAVCCWCAEPAIIYDSGDSYCAQHYYEATGEHLE